MINTLLGTKIKMTQTFEGNVRTPVTVVNAGPCVVTMVKTSDRDGYQAVQLGFGSKKIKNTTRAMQGHLKGATQDNKAPRFLREVHTENEEALKAGDSIKVTDIFAVGDTVQVTGISKGHGFQGGVKRYGFAGGPKTHGQSDRHRSPGSIGQGTTPGRVYKGKRMAGHMGVEQVTVKNLSVVAVNAETNELWIRGPIPGSKGSLVIVKRLSENKIVPAVATTEVAAPEEGGQES
jgi:large subunit ribosomal protein L3